MSGCGADRGNSHVLTDQQSLGISQISVPERCSVAAFANVYLIIAVFEKQMNCEKLKINYL